MLMLPEIIVVLSAFIVLIVDLFIEEKKRDILAPLATLGMVIAFFALWILPHSGQAFAGRFVQDAVSLWFKSFFLFASIFTVILSADLLNGKTRIRVKGMGHRGEFFTILLFTLAGAMFLISSRDLITLYVSLELATIPLFVLTAWRRDDHKGAEAALKYIIVGALASAFILYGLSFLFGLTGEMSLAVIAKKLHPSPALFLAIGLILSGIGFKMALVPFHLWAADVYEGAPVPITAYLSVASKGVGLTFMFQLFFRVFGAQLAQWSMLLAIVAMLTMTLGNVVAIVQDNIKRFMAFSSISQAGYLLMGFIGGYQEGVSAMLFYLLVYIFTNLTVFAVIIWFSNATGKEEIADYKGLSRTNPLVALAMMLGLFSLAGIPPLSGFVGKFFLFSVVAKAGFYWLVAIAAVNSTISLFYYLRIVRQMYIEPPTEEESSLPVSSSIIFALTATTLATLLLGIVPWIYESIHTTTISWLAMLVK